MFNKKKIRVLKNENLGLNQKIHLEETMKKLIEEKIKTILDKVINENHDILKYYEYDDGIYIILVHNYKPNHKYLYTYSISENLNKDWISYIDMEINDNKVELVNILTKPIFRSKKHGEKLINAFEDYLTDLGFKGKIYGDVDQTGEVKRIENFYNRKGYKVENMKFYKEI
ncbi:MAG: hypothetical protein ACLTUN_07270 [Paraclostridium sordellii]